MKKTLLTVILAVLGTIGITQTLVVTTPQHRNVVLEEFTGIHCGYCPDGHVRAQAIADANPGRVVLVNVHAGGYAVPSAGEPDFRTIFGENLVTFMGVDGYPSGAVNRHVFTEIGTTISMGRGAWAYASYKTLPQVSPVNAGFTSSFNPVTRELTVNVELYYPMSSPTASNFIQVALLENHVLGYQSDYANGDQANYDHKHILRHFLTGQWGDEVTTTSQGSVVQRTYTYVVPSTYNITNCDVAVYVTESQSEVYTGVQAVADGGSNDGATAIYTGHFPEPADNVAKADATTPAQFTTTFTPLLAGNELYEFTLESNAPAAWISGFSVNGTNFTSTGTVTLPGGAAVDIAIEVTPQTTPALAEYTLIMKSVNYPTAPEKEIKLYVIDGINTLIADGTGSWGNGESYDFSDQFINGLGLAGCSTLGYTHAGILEKGLSSGDFSDVKNVFLNIGWRFPSLQDAEATAIMNFLDNGGNLFIAGQDIGWDINDANGYGTTITKNFYTNYLHAAFSNDGTTANNTLNANATDSVFGGVASSPVTDIFSGNMYPDQLIGTSGALPIFYYGTGTTKVAGLRYTNGTYKTVYLGVDLAMLSLEGTRNQILEEAYQWFVGPQIGFDQPETGLFSLYPNPARDEFMVVADQANGNPFTVQVLDAMGRVVASAGSESAQSIRIITSTWTPGIYLVKIQTPKGFIQQAVSIR